MSGNVPTAAKELVKKFEGLPDGNPATPNFDPYMDPSGYWTIGWGHLLTDSEGRPLRGEEDRAKALAMYPNGLTEEEADKLLDRDLELVAKQVDELVTVPLNENERAALISFVFNVGVNNFRDSTLLRKLNTGDRKGAAKEFLRWVYSDGRKLPGLVRRREAERMLFVRPVIVEPKPLTRSKTIAGAATAAISSTGLFLADMAAELGKHFPMFEKFSRYLGDHGKMIVSLFAGFAIFGSLIAITERVRDRKKGIK